MCAVSAICSIFSFIKFQRCKIKISFLMIIFAMGMISSQSEDSSTTLSPEWQFLDQIPENFRSKLLTAISKIQFEASSAKYEASSAKYEASSVRVLASTFSNTITALSQQIVNINETLMCTDAIRFLTTFMEDSYINKLPSKTFRETEPDYAISHDAFRNNPSQIIYHIFRRRGFKYNMDTQKVEYNITGEQDGLPSSTPKKNKTTLSLRDIRRWHRWVWFIDIISKIEIEQDVFLLFWKQLTTFFRKQYNCRLMCFSKTVVKAISNANKRHHFSDPDLIDFLSMPIGDIQDFSLQYATCITNFHHRYCLKNMLTTGTRKSLDSTDEQFAIDKDFICNVNISAIFQDIFSEMGKNKLLIDR